MALIPYVALTTSGVGPTPGNAAAGDTAPVGKGYYMLVSNGSASSINCTIAVPGVLATGDPYPPKVYAVPASGERWIPLLDIYADQSDGAAHITWSATASVTRRVFYTGG